MIPKNSFLSGLGSVLNIFGNYFEYDFSKTANEADENALYSDWSTIGNDIESARDNLCDELTKDSCLK